MPRQLTSTLAAVAILAVGGRQLNAQGAQAPVPAPGRLVDLGGWRLHLNCIGAAAASQPTVILEAGAGAFSVDWSLVQPGVAAFARVCSYDRAGSGWSDLGPRPRTMHQIVWELHAVLQRAGERPPFVLAGHSFGGALVRLYASTYPAEVAGVVLVDSQHDDYVRLTGAGEVMASSLASGRPIPPVKTSDPLREADIPPEALRQIQSMASWNARHANEPPRDKLPAEAQLMRSWGTAQVKHAASNDNPFEGDELLAMQAERKNRQYPLGDLPLVVLTRGLAEFSGPDAAARDEQRRKDQAELATRSRAGRQIVVPSSGHHIDLEAPDVVVRAIRDVLGRRP
jgi:pimeloyl-ACP methyl ester carboxylesterase